MADEPAYPYLITLGEGELRVMRRFSLEAWLSSVTENTTVLISLRFYGFLMDEQSKSQRFRVISWMLTNFGVCF